MNDEDNKVLEMIRSIREFIKKLEDIIDEIIDHLNSLKKLDGSTKNIWTADVKEFFYNIVNAWEMLRTGAAGESKLKNIANSKSYLYAARNRLSLIISELKIFDSQKSSTLIERAEKAFKECWDAYWIVFNKLLPDKKIVKPIETVIKVSDLEYHLPCSVCGKIDVEFKIGYGRFD